jgi:hypothetical protein
MLAIDLHGWMAQRGVLPKLLNCTFELRIGLTHEVVSQIREAYFLE